MRILVFTTAYKPFIGGSEIAIESIARELPGVVFDILTPRYSRGVPAYESLDNVHIKRLGLGVKWDKFLFPLFGGLVGWRMSSINKYTAFHSYQASFGALAAIIARTFSARLPLVVTLQEGKDLASQSWVVQIVRRIIIRRADGLTAISNYLAEFARSVRQNVDVKIIPNGVDVSLFSRLPNTDASETKRKLNLAPDKKIIVAISRLVQKNGLENLIRAMPIILEEKPSHLVIIGSGPLQVALKNLVLDLRIGEHVTFVGSVPHKQLPLYLSCADVFVRASLSEGMGNVFLEAMAASVPIVASPVGGIVDFVIDRETGMLCDPKNPVSIADKVLLLLEDRELREGIIARGRKLVEEKYEWRIIAKQMNDLYNSLATKN